MYESSSALMYMEWYHVYLNRFSLDESHCSYALMHQGTKLISLLVCVNVYGGALMYVGMSRQKHKASLGVRIKSGFP